MLQSFCIGWILGISFMGFMFWNPQLSTAQLLFIVLIWLVLQLYISPKLKSIFSKILQLSANLCIGAILGFSFANTQLDQRLALVEHQSRQGEFIAYIPQISQLKDQAIQQKIEVLNLNQQIQYFMAYLPNSILQNNEQTIQLVPGQYYRMYGELRPTQSYVTEGAFDQERWSVQQNIHASLKVKSVELIPPQHVIAMGYGQQYQRHQGVLHQLKIKVEQQRLYLRAFIYQQPLRNHGLLLALLTGDKSLLTEGTSELFQRFGMSHLLAISGPHVLVFASMLCWAMQLGIRKYCPKIYPKWPKQYGLVVPFIFCVLLYCAFTGFEIPALRTLTICLVASSMLLLRQTIQPFQLLIFSAAILLLVDPFSILSAAFWLSYGACFILLRIYQTLRKHILAQTEVSFWQKLKHSMWLMVESQWKIFVALFPLMVIFFKQVTWISPLSNLFAIPWLGAVVVPLDIIGGALSYISTPLAQLVFLFNDLCLEILHVFLYGLDRLFAPKMQDVALTSTQILLLILAIVILFLPEGILPKYWSVIAFFALFIPWKNSANFQLSILDVGQGQAIYIRSVDHHMMVDFGGNYDESQFSVGQNIIRPFLSVNGVHRLDRVLLTHLDQDHSGGFFSLEQQLDIGQLSSNERVQTTNQAPQRLCQRGQQWNWDQQVYFEILSPKPEDLTDAKWNANERSCVLYVTVKDVNGPRHFLLMGDAGWESEYQILSDYPDLKVDVLVLGHHGSRHSSSYAFLTHFKPKLAIASAGRFNRYGHPAKMTKTRLKQLDIPLLQTAQSGSIHFKQNKQQIELIEERTKYKWLDLYRRLSKESE